MSAEPGTVDEGLTAFARDAGREQIERLQAALVASGTGTWRFDLVADSVDWDTPLKALYGLPADAALSLDRFLGLVHPDDRARVADAGWRSLRAGVPYREEFRIVRPDGEVRWIIDTGRVAYDADGTAVAMTGAAVDVTERKAMELALRASERLLREAQRVARVGSWEWDVVANRLVWSDVLCAHYGITVERAPVGIEGVLALVHPDDRAPVGAVVERALADGRPFAFVHRAIRPDGSVRTLQVRGDVIADGAGRPLRLVGSTEDVTDAIAAQVAQQAAQAAAERAAVRVRQLQALSDALSHAFTVDEVARVILSEGMALAGADAGFLARVDDDGDDGEIVLHRGFDETAGEEPRVFRIHERLPAAVALRSRAPVWIETREDRDTRFDARLGAMPFVGAAVLPLVVDGHAIGAIGFRYRDAHVFAPEERDFLGALAAQCGQAVLRATLFDAERLARAAAERERRRIEQLQALTAALAAAADEREVAAVVLGQGLAAFGTTAGTVARVLDDEDAIEIIAHAGYGDAIADRHRRHPLAAPSPITDAIRAGEPIRIADRATLHARYPYLVDVFEGMGAAGYVALPLRVADRTIGGIALYLAEPERFGDDDWRMLVTFGGLCGQAMARARHFDAEQTERAEQAFLAAAGAALAESLDSRATLQRVADLAMSALGDWCVVCLADATSDAIRRAAIAAPPGIAPTLLELERRYPITRASGGAVAHVVNEGVEVVVPEMTDAQLEAMAMDAGHLELLRSLRYRSALVLPLRARNTVIGALLLGMAGSGPPLTRRVIDVARRLAERAALAIDNARLYEAVRQANRVKSEFLAVMSHELRTPLNAIGGYVELLALELRGPVTAAQRRDLERIRVSQQHLLGLISAVLDLSRIESGRVVYDLETIPVDAFLQSLDALIAPQVAASALSLAYDACPPSLGVRADREKLRQVVLNLLSNAVRYTPAGGRIRLTASAQGALAQIVVADTGIGIAPDALERIFEPFVQLDRSLTRGRDGVGLGLAISRDLARGMGGDLTATSEPGVGSIFTLTLPRARIDGTTSWSATSEIEAIPRP